MDNRHRIGNDSTPSELGGQSGYLSQTGMLFSHKHTVLVDFNWQQKFNEGQSALIIGRYDPNDYMDALGYVNPFTAFSNLDILLDMSIALPDNSWGIGGGHWFNESVYILGGLNDANGTVDTLQFFDGGSEFFKYVELGWSPSQGERYFKNINVTLWEMDDRSAYGENNTSNDGSYGIALAANWIWDHEWVKFLMNLLTHYKQPMIHKPLLKHFIASRSHKT